MGRVLSQSEIDALLTGLLQDTSVLPESEDSPQLAGMSVQEDVPVGIAAFKAKLAAAQAEKPVSEQGAFS